MGGRSSGSGFKAGSPTASTPAGSQPQMVQMNGRTYRVKGIIRGDTMDFADAEFQHNGAWHPVRNVQMQINLARLVLASRR